jgi:hypothetical protein
MRSIKTVVAVVACCAAAEATSGADSAGRHADLVLENGVVYTLDAQRPKAQAVAIAGGAILGVGANEDIRRLVGPTTRVIDLAGAMVIPGFHESHAHLLSVGLAKMSVDLVGTKSYSEVVERVAATVKTRKPGEWILGRGWHEGKWAEAAPGAVRGFPTHTALSAVSPDNPVVLTRADGHAILVNAKVMELMRLTKDTQAPAGGEIIRLADGSPTGVLVDNAKDLVRVPPPSAAQNRRALELAMEECLAKGITSLDDAGADMDAVALYKEHALGGTLRIRVYAMLAGADTLRRFEEPEIGLGGGFLTIRSVKLYADGALGSRGAALLEPYSDDPGNSGFFVTPPQALLDATRYALAHGFQVCTHAIGDRANRMVLDTYEQAMKEYPASKDPRLRIEHAQILDAADVPRFAKLGVIASMQGIHATSDRPWAANRLDMDRVTEGAYVWRKLLASGARIANGTDAPVEDVSPVKSFYASVTRQDETGQPAGGFDPQQRMTREQALRSYTLDPAYATFQERTLGSIEIGKRADLTVLSRDIMTVPDAEILKADVFYTIVGGRVQFSKGR